MSSGTKSAYNDNYSSIPGLYATTDLSAAQFKAVKLLTTGNQIALIATSVITSGVSGILMNDPKGTLANPVNAEVAIRGIVKMIAGTSTIKIGDQLGVNTTGYVVPTTTDNRWVIAKALVPSSAIGDIICGILLDGGQRY